MARRVIIARRNRRLLLVKLTAKLLIAAFAKFMGVEPDEHMAIPNLPRARLVW